MRPWMMGDPTWMSSVFRNSPQEPELSADELQRLDSIADQVEVERSGLQVLQEDNLPHDAKSLSTRFARTWERKGQARQRYLVTS